MRDSLIYPGDCNLRSTRGLSNLKIDFIIGANSHLHGHIHASHFLLGFDLRFRPSPYSPLHFCIVVVVQLRPCA